MNYSALARETGADHFLIKPPSEEELRATLQTIALIDRTGRCQPAPVR
jgi:hypothetical protein